MKTEPASSEPYAAFIGIDWADKEHEVCLQPANGSARQHHKLAQDPNALQSWIGQLRQQFGGQKIALAVELSRGPLLVGIAGAEFLVLYPINPKSLARYREAFRPSGAKDDRDDAQLLCDFVRHHWPQLKAWQPEDAATRELAGLVRVRRYWVDEVVSKVERLRADLKNYYPLVLELFPEDLGQRIALCFLQRWPNLQRLQAASQAELRQFFYGQNSRSEKWMQRRWELISQARPLTEDAAVLGIHQRDTEVLVEVLQVLVQNIAGLEKRIAELFRAHPDGFIFESLPGAGKTLAPRLLTACGTDRKRFESPKALQQLSGIAPITIQSGETEYQVFRFAAPWFMHQSFWEFAKCSILYCPWAKAFVDYKMSKGMGFNAAVRALGFKWIRIIWRIWQNREVYDEKKYLAALRRYKSPYAVASRSPRKPLK